MLIINRASRELAWEAYRTDDRAASFCLPNKRGSIPAGKFFEVGMEQHSVKLKIGTKLFDGPFINTGVVVINPSEKPIMIDEYRARFIDLAGATKAKAGSAELDQLNSEAKRVLSWTRAVLNLFSGKLAPIKGLGTLLIAVLVDIHELKQADLGATPEGIAFAKGFNLWSVGVENGGDSPSSIIRGYMEDLKAMQIAVLATASQAGQKANPI